MVFLEKVGSPNNYLNPMVKEGRTKPDDYDPLDFPG